MEAAVSTLNEGPMPLSEIRKTQRPTEPVFRGFRLVKCSNCGSRGNVNLGLLGKRQWTIPECVGCRDS
jgi:hypothetical protein